MVHRNEWGVMFTIVICGPASQGSGQFNSLHVDILRTSALINTKNNVISLMSKHCLANPGHCQWTDLHR